MKKINTSPALKFVFILSIGILIGKEFLFNIFFLISIIILLIVLFIFYKKSDKIVKSFTLGLLILILGITKANIDFNTLNKNSVLNLNKNYTDCCIVGVINNLPEYKVDRVRFIVNSEKLIYANDTLNISGEILINCKETKNIGDSLPELNAGDRISIFGDLMDANAENNPGEFNYRKYLALNDIHKLFRVYFYSDISIINSDNLNFFEQKIIFPSRKFAIENINELVKGDEAAFLNGLVTGYRGDFSKELREDFLKAGVMHLIAVSGLNVAYIIIFLTLLFSFLRVPLIYRISLILLALIFYIFFTGAAASIVRAGIMGALVLMTFIVQRKINFYNIIGFSALVILLIDSRQLFDAGFILSYSAVLSLVYFMDLLNPFIAKIKISKNKKINRIALQLILLISTTFVAQLGTLPIVLIYFEKFSIIGYITNIVAIPLSNISLALGFIQIILSTFSNFLASLVAESNSLLLFLQLKFINFCASFDWSYVDIFGITITIAIFYYVILILISSAKQKNIKYRISISIILVLIYFIFFKPQSDKSQITFLSLGNSNCTHIETSDGSNILIDIGNENYYTKSNSNKVIPYLKRKNVSDLDLVIIHNDINKNYYGLKNITDNFNIKKLIFTNKEIIDNRLENLLSEKKISAENVRYIDNIKGFGDIKIYFLKTDKYFLTKIYFDTLSVLICDKTDYDNEKEFTYLYKDFLKSDIYRASNYGSDNSSNIEFISKIKPQYCIVSGSEKKSAVSDIFKKRFSELNSELLRTDIEGAIVFLKEKEYFKRIR